MKIRLIKKILVSIIILFAATTSVVFANTGNPVFESHLIKKAKISAMTQKRMEKIIRKHVGDTEGSKGHITFIYKNIPLMCVSDVAHNRMRIIAPIDKSSNVSFPQIQLMMESNFHAALDARYATSNGILYAAFIHPLSSLTEEQIISALDQVATLALTFGTTYTSGGLIFNGGQNQAEPYPAKSKEIDL